MGKIIFLLISLIFLPTLVFGQTKVYGTITDLDKKALNSVSVIVKDTTDNILSYTYSDKNGLYTVDVKTAGEFQLSFSSLGFQSKTIIIHLDKHQKELEINAVLETSSQQLDAVNIKSEQPISVKKDTVTVKTKFFTNGTEETVEDLLKKIPGLNISSEGTIKIGNTEIEKLMVEGDDFFGKGYKILSKNMPAYPIDKVEILKHYSNNKLLKGVEESDKVALNLKLDEKAKRVWFGNVEAGGGNHHFYQLKGNLMNFGKKNKYYFLGSLNNTGSQVTGDIGPLISSDNIGDPSNLGHGKSAERLIPPATGGTPLGKGRSNFNNDKLLSLNAIFNPNDKLKIKPLLFLDWKRQRFFRDHQENINIENTNFTNTEQYQMGRKDQRVFGKLDMHYDISKTQRLSSSTRYTNHHNITDTDLDFNGHSTLEQLKDRGSLFDQKINYTNKFEPHKVLMITGRFIDAKAPESYKFNQFYYQDLFPEMADANHVEQRSTDRMQYMGIHAHYFDRQKNGNLFELQLGDELQNDKLETGFSIFEDENLLDNPQEFQNHTDYMVNDLYFKSKYLFSLGHFMLGPSLSFHQLTNKLEAASTSSHESPFFVNPKFNAAWQINDHNTITTYYAYNKSNAGVLDVYDKYVLTGFRSFNRGAGEFNQLSTSSVGLSYNLGNWTDLFFGDISLIYDKNHDFFSTRSIVQKEFIQSEKILIKGPETFQANAEANYYFEHLSTNLKLKLAYTQSHFKNSVNSSDLRAITSLNYNYGLELKSVFEGVFNYNIGAKWTTHQMETEVKNSFTNSKAFLDLDFKFSDRFDAKIKSDFYHFGSLQKDKDYYFLDFEANYSLIPKTLSLRLTGKNLFDTKTFRTYNISDIGYSTTAYRLLPRMLLLKLKYRF